MYTVTATLQIVSAIRLREQIRGEWLLILTGVLSVAFGVLIAFFPGAGALGMVIVIGAYLIGFGMLLIVFGVRVRKWLRAAAGHPEGRIAMAFGH